MGWVTINGTQVHTSNIGITSSASSSNSTITISGTSGTIYAGSGSLYSSSSGTFTIQPSTTTYHILGEDIEVEGYKDFNVASSIALINVLGKPYYDELKKQDVHFPQEIEDYLEKKFIILERDRKINEVIKK